MLGGWRMRSGDRPDTRAERRDRRRRHPRARSSPRPVPASSPTATRTSRPARVAEAAEVPLSQIHYHFGSKRQLILAVLEAENERLLERQRAMFDGRSRSGSAGSGPATSSTTDVASGYVRILQEMIAAGWSDPEVAAAVREMIGGWYRLLAEVARARAGARRRPRRVHARGGRAP